jgi:hypothetical protein
VFARFGVIDRRTFGACSRLDAILYVCHPRLVNGYPHVVGGRVEGIDPLSLHVPEEVHEVSAVGLDRVVGEERIADPGDQGPGGGGASVPVAASAWARKASTLSTAGASPSRKSLRSGTRGTRAGAGGRAGRSQLSFVHVFFAFMGVGMEFISFSLPDKATYIKQILSLPAERVRKQSDGRNSR